MKTETVNGHKVACYDNGGKTADRYIAVFLDLPERARGVYFCYGMDRDPFHPQGCGMSGAAMPGRHLGRRVPLASLPEPCQRLVRSV